VFAAIEEQEGTQQRRAAGGDAASSAAHPAQAHRRVHSINTTPAAALMLDLVREWLDFYELDYTASTLTAEAALNVNVPGSAAGGSSSGGGGGSSSPTAQKDRASLAAAIHLPSGPSEHRPLLVDLLMLVQQMAGGAHGGSGSTFPRNMPTHSPSHSFDDNKASLTTTTTTTRGQATQPTAM
jgi:hypothetical protein